MAVVSSLFWCTSCTQPFAWKISNAVVILFQRCSVSLLLWLQAVIFVQFVAWHFILMEKAAYFPFCWYFIFSYRAKIATHLHDLCAFELANILSFVKGISIPAVIFWFFRLLGLCYFGCSLFLYENIQSYGLTATTLFGLDDLPQVITRTLRGVAAQKYALQFRFILRNWTAKCPGGFS